MKSRNEFEQHWLGLTLLFTLEISPRKRCLRDSALGEMKAVRGNMDSGELKRMLPEKELFVVNGKKIGLTHGSGGSWGIAGRIRQLFGDVDLIIFGHSHEPCNQYLQGSLLFNPGRAGDSFGLLTIDDEIKAEIIKV